MASSVQWRFSQWWFSFSGWNYGDRGRIEGVWMAATLGCGVGAALGSVFPAVEPGLMQHPGVRTIAEAILAGSVLQIRSSLGCLQS
jgi:hypothetical protein